MADNQKDQLFAQYRMCIVRTEFLNENLASQIASNIRKHGGEAVIYLSSVPSSSIHEFTHIVSTTVDFPGHYAARDALLPVVKPQWVEVSISRSKLANPRQYNPDPKLFLNAVVVSCADLPEGDKDAIIGGVVAMGGLYTSRMTSSTTHLVALTMDSDKCKMAVKRGLDVKIVLPHWFDDCLKLGKRIDERPYMLPDPEILRLRSDAPVRYTKDNQDIIGASTPEPRELPAPLLSSDDGRYGLDVFQDKKVMLSEDLAIGDRLRLSIEALIQTGGGQLVHDVRETDIYICKFREGDDYQTASRLGKDVGNLSWLYYLITYNTWTSPLRRLLHYPIVRGGIPGFQNLKISLSNYAGEARIYLENLIAAAGAECTKTLKQDNTHLITARESSEKCTAAREWNLHVVNHLWLEESYAKWQVQAVSAHRYTHFPKRTNLGEVVGQTEIDRFAIEARFFPPVPNDSAEKATNGQRKKKSPATKAAQNLAQKKSNPAKPPAASSTLTPRSAKESVTLADTNSNKKSASKILRTPLVSRFAGEGKENDTPSTTGSRKSKDIATARLHEYAPDIALYEKERKRVGGVIYGGRRKSGDEVIVRKRSAEPEEDVDEEEVVEAKKPKKGKPSVSMHLLITGYPRWIGNAKLEDADKRRLRDLGILITQDASKCTHLAAPSILRTRKFVNALAYSPQILSSDYVTDCIEQDELLDPEDYILQDKEAEKRYDFSLEEARLRAKANKNKLLQGRTIYCMEHIHGGFEAYKSIVETNGGQCAMFRGRPGTIITGRRAADDDESANSASEREVYLISGHDKNHAKLWPKFRTLVHDAKKIPKIVRSDWLLDSVLCQELRWKDEWELTEEDVEMGGE